MRSSLLCEVPRTYLFWWTVIAALPESRSDPYYAMLKRLWADHTVNCLSDKSGILKPASSRGFYIQTREDYVSPALFHLWAAFPGYNWVGPLLDLWDVPHGRVRKLDGAFLGRRGGVPSRRPDITDIVLCWEDDLGQAVFVIEAKRVGGKLSDKDLDGGSAYLQLPSIKAYDRKCVGFLVSDGESRGAAAKLPPGTRIATWQAVGKCQSSYACNLGIGLPALDLVKSYFAKHYRDLGMPFEDDLSPVERYIFEGSETGYGRVRELGVSDSIERFLLGSEAVFCARTGRMPQPPFEWLAEEPSCIDVNSRRISDHTR